MLVGLDRSLQTYLVCQVVNLEGLSDDLEKLVLIYFYILNLLQFLSQVYIIMGHVVLKRLIISLQNFILSFLSLNQGICRSRSLFSMMTISYCILSLFFRCLFNEVYVIFDSFVLLQTTHMVHLN